MRVLLKVKYLAPKRVCRSDKKIRNGSIPACCLFCNFSFTSPHPPPPHTHTHKITEGHIPEEPEVQRDWKQYRQGMLGWLGAGLRGRESLPMLCYSAVTPSGSVRRYTFELRGMTTKTRIKFCST